MKFEYDGYKVEIDIPEEYKSIGFNLSGGADSSLWLYLLVKYLKDNNRTDVKIHILTGSYADKGYGVSTISNRVLKFVLDELEAHDVIDTNTQFFKYDRTQEDFRSVWLDWWKSGKIDVMTNAMTSMPKDLDAETEDSKGNIVKLFETKDAPLERGDGTHPIWSYRIPETKTHAAYHPFAAVDKKFIFQIYKDYELIDTLYPITRSCECTEAHLCDNWEGHCGDCWWCLERKWAFGKL
jgi:hypothetical protein